jgi:N-acyl-D-amino-acid deacylase
MYDLLLKDGRIIDGTSNPWFRGDLAVNEGIIEEIGRIRGGADTVINVHGLVVSPGFIDTHSHSDLFLLSEPEAKSKTMQGVTTEIVGQDGLGEAPITDEWIGDWRRYLSGLNGDPEIDWSWRSIREYLEALEGINPSINAATLVGYGNLRVCALGMENRPPEESEIETMRRQLENSIKDGAVGLSTGLIYPPCSYCETEELIDMCRVVSENAGVFVVHMRNEGDHLLKSIDEVMRIGIEADVPVHISHFKSSGEKNHGKSIDALNALEEARRLGVQVTYDQYPYTAGSTFLSSLLPTWAHEGGTEALLKRLKDNETRTRIRREIRNDGSRVINWDKLLVTSVETEKNKHYEGQTMRDIAASRGQDEANTLMDLVLEEGNAVAMASFTMNESDVENIMVNTYGMICSDGILLGKPHPRVYGSFPRVLGHYVRKGTLRLEEAVRRMTSYPAQTFGLDRGVLRPGLPADITVFDPTRILDKATYEDPRRYPEGIDYVIVNGVMTVEKGKHTGARAGRIHRHKR